MRDRNSSRHSNTTRPFFARDERAPATLQGGCNSALLEGVGAAKAEERVAVCSGCGPVYLRSSARQAHLSCIRQVPPVACPSSSLPVSLPVSLQPVCLCLSISLSVLLLVLVFISESLDGSL